MNSLERNFELKQKESPSFSTFLIYSSIIRGQKYGRDVIEKNFYKLVDKADWKGSKIDEIMDYLHIKNMSSK